MRNFIAMLFFLSVGISYGQGKEITGTITDSETGDPVISATVIIKNTKIGTSTDFDGKFKLNAKEGDVLLITSLGYKSKEIIIGQEQQFNIQLLQSTAMLDEIVVVGFGTQSRASLTGAVSVVKSADIVKNSTSNISSALSGRLAGLVVVQSSGEPGRDQSSLRIRGMSTYNNSAPLVLVDGIRRPMNSINSNDIESITVLKDAAAGSIYGMKAANGVVQPL
jgi:TonB-dependent SusC/RagA subfamily outer membrane receptor